MVLSRSEGGGGGGTENGGLHSSNLRMHSCSLNSLVIVFLDKIRHYKYLHPENKETHDYTRQMTRLMN